MSPGHGWKPGHPLFCPECGEPTACRAPGDSRFGGLGVALALLGCALAAPYADLGATIGSLYVFGIIGPCIVVVLWLRSNGLLPVSREGFVLCLECGWMRSGARTGTRLGRLRNRTVAWARRIVFSLLPVVVFFGTIGLGWDRPGALLLASALLWPLGLGLDVIVAHRPREWPPAGPPPDERAG